MKASSVLQSTEPSTFAQPRISYARALRASFTWRGQTHVVGTCDQAILQAFLMHHAALARLKADQLRELLEILDFGELGRW